MEEKFLSRKQRRKMERKAKKEKKDLFYRNSKINKQKRKNSIDNNLTERESKNDNKEIKKVKTNEKNKKEINETENKKLKVQKDEILDDIDKEIEYLEGKLGLKDEKNVKKLTKTLTIENYDPDLLDFLDNIDSVVQKEDITSYKKSKNSLKEKEIKEEYDDNEEEEEELEEEKEEEEEEEEELPKIKQLKKIRPKKEEQKQKKKVEKPLSLNEIEQNEKFKKELTSLMNKIAESNISFLLPDVFTKITNFTKNNKNTFFLYDTVSKIALKLLLSQKITNLPITGCICTFISIFHYKYGNNFIYFYLKQLLDQIGSFEDQAIPKHKIKNFIFQIILFYLFQNITSTLIYDLIKYFIDNFNENFSEYLLLLLSYTGIEIRKDNPENLKDIITEINKTYNTMKLQSSEGNKENLTKIEYIIEMIEDIRVNKYLKFNLSEKFSFFRNFITSNVNADIKKGDKVELTLEQIKKIDCDMVCDSNFNLDNDDKKDKETNKLLSLENLESYMPDDLVDESTNKILEQKMKKLNITTKLKKMIFTSIVKSSDINDAFERLMRLNLKKEQSREIIKIIVQICSEEKKYNPFYRILLERLIEVNKDHKYTYHYCIWDYMKIFQNYKQSELKKIHNLSKLTAKLLVDEKISLPVLLHFKFEESDENTRLFVIFMLDFYFESSNETKTKIIFAKLVKNDDHVEFAQRLCQFLINEFTKEINVTEKSETYQENYGSAVRLLKKVL